MNIEKIKILLNKYNWILDSEMPLNISSKNGEHKANNFAAEIVIEYFMLLDQSNNIEEKDATIERFKI